MIEETFNELMIELKGDEMPSLARIWMDEGIEEGRMREIRNSIKRGFELKFKKVSDKMVLTIKEISEMDKLQEIQDVLYLSNDPDEFQRFVKKST